MHLYLSRLNAMLRNPTKTNIFDIFSCSGYLRFNMLYSSPLVFKYFKQKLTEYNLINWYFTENELVFEFKNFKITFKGRLTISEYDKIFSLELDFDPIVSNNESLDFLIDVETFLKKADSIFFMTHLIGIDTDILSQPLSRSIDYLMYRK